MAQGDRLLKVRHRGGAGTLRQMAQTTQLQREDVGWIAVQTRVADVNGLMVASG